MNLKEKLDYIRSLDLDNPSKTELSEVIQGQRNFCVLYFKDCQPERHDPVSNTFYYPPELERKVIDQLTPLLDGDTPFHQGFDIKDEHYQTRGSCQRYPVILNPVVQRLQIIFGNWQEFDGEDYGSDPCKSCRKKPRVSPHRLIFKSALQKVLQ